MQSNSRKFFIGASMFSWFMSSAALHLNRDNYWSTLITIKSIVFTFLGMLFISVFIGLAWYKLFDCLTAKQNLQPDSIETIKKWNTLRELFKLTNLMSVFIIAYISFNFFYHL